MTRWPARDCAIAKPATASPSPPVLAYGQYSAVRWTTVDTSWTAIGHAGGTDTIGFRQGRCACTGASCAELLTLCLEISHHFLKLHLERQHGLYATTYYPNFVVL